MNDASCLEMERVSKGYAGKEGWTPVLADVNCAIGRGEFVAVVGYSGSGKTTFLSLLAGLIAPERGAVTMNGRPVKGPGPERGVVFQNYSLLPWLTVWENVSLAVDRVFAEWSRERRRDHVAKYIEMVRLTPALRKKPAQLSGGMRQRVALARALATDPRVLLLDEPLSALDALNRASLQGELQRICAETGKTVVMVTNDIDEAVLLAERIFPLTPGPAATLGPPVHVPFPRPRDRHSLNRDKRFHDVRREVIDFLLRCRELQQKSEGASRRDAASLDYSAHTRRPPGKNGLLESKRSALGKQGNPLPATTEREIFVGFEDAGAV